MQAYLLSGLRSPTSSFNPFLPLHKPRVSNHSSVHYHYHNNQLKLTLHHHHHRPTPGRNGVILEAAGAGAAAAETHRDHQDHYAVLGISPTASSTEIKSAYRLLAKKYHPDVCKDSKSSEVFKSIRHAYDVLSNEVTRSQYDSNRRFQGDPRWQGKRYSQQSETDKSSDESDTSEENSSVFERDSFNDVLLSTLFALFFMQNNVSQLRLFGFSLSAVYLFSRTLIAFSDSNLDGEFKWGYLIAWFLGGRNGVLLTLCISFESWAFGKRDGSRVTGIIVFLWVVTNFVKLVVNLAIFPVRVGINLVMVGTNLARYALCSIPQAALTKAGIDLATRYASSSIPHGALIALLYLSIKLHNDLKFKVNSTS